MATSAVGGQAVAVAAALCKKYNCSPRELGENYLKELQLELWRSGQYLPQTDIKDSNDLVQEAAQITASSTLKLAELPGSDFWVTIKDSVGQMLPVVPGKAPAITFWVDAEEATALNIELRKSSKAFNHTPDVTLETKQFELTKGKNEIKVEWEAAFNEASYAFVCFMKNEKVKLQYSETRVTGVVSVFNATNPAVSNYGKQEPTEDIGVDTFEFWCPQRRPEGRNVAMRFDHPISVFGTDNLTNGLHRPISKPNAWVADLHDKSPLLTVSWNEPATISKVEFVFDTDYDHPMENVIYVHPETVMPFCVNDVVITNCNDQIVGTITDNHLSKRTIVFEKPVTTQHLKIRLSGSNPNVPVSLMEVRCY